MKDIKRLLIIAAALIIAALPLGAFAELMEVDPFTGEIVSGDLSEVNRITITYECEYDRSTGLYNYVFTDGSGELQSNIAKGMMVQNAVQIIIPAGVTPTVYKDGVILEKPDLSNINQVGAYSISLDINGMTYSNAFNFYILGPYTGNLYNYELPEGFTFDQVYYNGQSIPVGSSVIDITNEGEYLFKYSCYKTGVQYSVKTVVDHTAPEMILDGVDEKNIAKGPVTMSGIEEGATLNVFLNDKYLRDPGTELRGTGEYLIVLKDQAGNVTNYQFEIRMYFDLNSWIFIFIIILLMAGIVLYIVFSRKHLRVR